MRGPVLGVRREYLHPSTQVIYRSGVDPPRVTPVSLPRHRTPGSAIKAMLITFRSFTHVIIADRNSILSLRSVSTAPVTSKALKPNAILGQCWGQSSDLVFRVRNFVQAVGLAHAEPETCPIGAVTPSAHRCKHRLAGEWRRSFVRTVYLQFLLGPGATNGADHNIRKVRLLPNNRYVLASAIQH
jgi:hypothetical protein